MSEHIYRLTARFVDAGTGEPLSAPNLKARFLDRDALKDDLLGESPIGADGRAGIVTTSSSFHSGLMGMLAAKLGEKKPDVYCEVVEGEEAIYRSRVAWNLDLEKENPVTGRTDRTIDLGTFKVKRGEGLGPPGVGTKPMRPTF